MSISLALLQIVALAANSSQPVLPVASSRQENTTFIDTYYMQDAAFFGLGLAGSGFTGFSTYDYGPFYVYVILEYLDRMCNDNVVSETNDWIAYLNNSSSPSYSGAPLRMLESGVTFSDFGLGWLTTFLTNDGQTYDPSQNHAVYPYSDDGYWCYALGHYLQNRGFTHDQTGVSGDFYINYGRANYVDDPDENEPMRDWEGTQEMNIKNAVDNNYPCVFTLNSSDTECEYPFFAVGYEDRWYYDPFLNPHIQHSYWPIGYCPHSGYVRTFAADDIVKSSYISFHGTHVHSDNLICTSAGHTYCGCGQITDCVSHDYHYTWLNNTSHRKTCADCGRSEIEAHQGRFCICMLQD